MNDQDYMRLAIEEAKKSEAAQGAPIGSVLVKDGKVIARGQSLVWPKKDPSAHAETECMRAACESLQTIDLTGCTLYSTLESCSMCLGMAGWANLSRIVFGAYKEDIGDNPYELADFHAEEHAKRLTPISGNKVQAQGGVLREECIPLMAKIHMWNPTY